MIRRPPRSTRTYTLFPYTTLFRSDIAVDAENMSDTITRHLHLQSDRGMLAGGDLDILNAWSKKASSEDHALLDKRLDPRSEEHTSELQSLMRISYAVFCLKKKKNNRPNKNSHIIQSKQNHSN